MNSDGDRLSNMMDVSELWTNEDLNFFINIQTPIHKKKGDLLFPASRRNQLHEEDPSTGLSMSPLLLLEKDVRVGASLHSTQDQKKDTSQHSSNKLLPQSSTTIMSRNEKRLTKPTSQPTHTRSTFSQNNILQNTLDKSSKKVEARDKKQRKVVNDENLSPNIIVTAQKDQKPLSNNIIPKKQVQIISPIPKLSQHEKQPTIKQATNLDPPHSQNQQLNDKKNNPENPPPLPSLPPQQLILKLFEEKQKRFLAKFKSDSHALLDYISSVTIDQ
ncbi:hypothetical protein C9374_001461 [Naegleria lovaniensis]|uniref:Uncharacterized protein n=1 Tax=Naegleria lovaniensis TaxID=51637 RepID=A0AA88KS95_NAELO|nr:uncharacterized protein C9374_001461 [Naegleria lovaniensis]KAG2387867.1 hypothetical protein C9374_001461 [Naegleria lovaniensis]